MMNSTKSPHVPATVTFSVTLRETSFRGSDSPGIVRKPLISIIISIGLQHVRGDVQCRTAPCVECAPERDPV